MLMGMTRTFRSSAALLAIALTATVTLAACGDKADTASAAAPTSRSASDGASVAPESFLQTVTAAQKKASTSHIELAISVGGQSITGKGDAEVGADVADSSMAMTMDLGATGMGSIDMRLVDEVFYLDFGQMTKGKFVTIDLTDKSNPIGRQYGQIIEKLDPSKQMEQFAKALTSIQEDGSPKLIDGVQAQPYVVVLDTAKLPGVSELTGGGAAKLPDTVTYTMFVGPDDLPRRIVTDVMGSKTSIDYSKWGEPVDVQAPAKSEISDQELAELMGDMPKI